jgi:hypothetical protein
MNDKRYWVGFNLVKGTGAVRLQFLLDHFGDRTLVWQPISILTWEGQAHPIDPKKIHQPLPVLRAGRELTPWDSSPGPIVGNRWTVANRCSVVEDLPRGIPVYGKMLIRPVDGMNTVHGCQEQSNIRCKA